MIRGFLINLGRFFRVLLVSVFVSILVVPFGTNILEIFLGRVASQDQVYLISVSLALVVSLVYTWQQRDRVNYDEVLFFVRNRLIKKRRLVFHLMKLQALLIVHVGGYDQQRRISFLEANSSAQAKIWVKGLLASLGANDKEREQALSWYLENLFSEYNDLTKELRYWSVEVKRLGPYAGEVIFTLLLRSLMGVNKGSQDYRHLLKHPLIFQVGVALVGKEVNENYYNRYFFLLEQEQMRLNHQGRNNKESQLSSDDVLEQDYELIIKERV